MINTKLRTVKNDYIDIQSDDSKIVNHFSSRINCTTNILQQFEEKIYDQFLQTETNINILDCGGNIGLFALHVKDCAKKIVSVEPTPDHIYIF
jgi:uncharacterized Rmd1/YagE family protein